MTDQICPIRLRPTRSAAEFLRNEAGAVTVDWVVLTAAIVLLGVAAGFLVTSSVPELANKIDTVLRSQTVLSN